MEFLKAIFLVILVFSLGTALLSVTNASPVLAWLVYIVPGVLITIFFAGKTLKDWRRHVEQMLKNRPKITDNDYETIYFDEVGAPIAIKLRQILENKYKINLSGLLPEDDVKKVIGYGVYIGFNRYDTLAGYIGGSFCVVINDSEWNHTNTFSEFVGLISRKRAGI